MKSSTTTTETNPFEHYKTQTIAVLGAQFGDEGKGKLVDILAPHAQLCARFNGGANAGHTIVIDNVKYAMHLLPCGSLYTQTKNLIGNGVVVHLKTLMDEMDALKVVNPNIYKQVFISSRAHLLFDLHQKVDACEETLKSESGNSIGTTKRGIGPCYASKVSRDGIRVGELKNFKLFTKKYLNLFLNYKKTYSIDIDPQKEIEQHFQYYEKIKDQIVDSVNMVHTSLNNGNSLLIEGANATMLDIDFGTYPFVTSSNTQIGGACIGLGIPPHILTFSVGVVKAYVTRVGGGPFVTELNDQISQFLLEKGHEYGTTTGRARRCGWLDIPMIKYANALNGFKAINLTKLDVLTTLKVIKVCTNYKSRSTGCLTSDLYYPTSQEEMDDIEPVYTHFEGWNEDLKNFKSFEELPKNAHTLVQSIEQMIGVPIKWVGVGPDRMDTISIN